MNLIYYVTTKFGQQPWNCTLISINLVCLSLKNEQATVAPQKTGTNSYVFQVGKTQGWNVTIFHAEWALGVKGVCDSLCLWWVAYAPIGTSGCLNRYQNMITWNPNDPCFDLKRPCLGGGGVTFKNRGHLGSRLLIWYLHVSNVSPYIYLPRTGKAWKHQEIDATLKMI